jgi:DNA repair protein RecO (recombination protein O)
MNDVAKVNGMVLSAMPIGEHDKRLVIETCELGRITVFARGCRRAGNSLLAVANPFVMGEFSIVPGRTSYRMTEASVNEYFRDLASQMPGVYIGFYFLDLVDYYGREGIDGTDMLNLLYVSLKALLKPEIDNLLIRRVFEMRLLFINGEYYPDENEMNASMFSICRYIIGSPLGKLYSFNLKQDALKELERICDRALKRTIDRELKSKKIMEAFLNI